MQKAKQDKVLQEKKEERERARKEFLRNKKMATAGANQAEGQQEAKGGVKFELVGIPDVMMEKPKKEKVNPANDPRLLVFDMGGNDEVKPFGKKPALSSEKKAYSKTKPAAKNEVLSPQAERRNPSA